ncbi:hypothetical protein ACIFQM_24260 [Paenibacillus sp. NRS-1782]|uniref:hypothetical protein n=1 Tax=unclassified Paenibacillus TaxID=185978 RepID=UPI001787D406|nr:hypothetical protein [Paenibacillus sp. 23TSA30-6]
MPRHYLTRISRHKLKQFCTDPDASSWMSADQVRETTTSYYQPAVEMLDIILKRKR